MTQIWRERVFRDKAVYVDISCVICDLQQPQMTPSLKELTLGRQNNVIF